MFADINSLPPEDPLRNLNKPAAPPVETAMPVGTKVAVNDVPTSLSQKVLAQFHANGGTTSVIADGDGTAKAPVVEPKVAPVVQAKGSGFVVDASKRVAVPSFEGAALRSVIEQAGEVGLRVQPVGSGLAREQVPAAGTMVPSGTEIVVRFTR